MRHRRDTYIGGSLVSGRVPNWDWSRNGGDYTNHRDFFTVHWEVQERTPAAVRLHVESPPALVDAELNGIKKQVVERMLADDLAAAVRAAGFEYQRGRMVSAASIARYKSTEAFRVLLPAQRCQNTAEASLEMVHAALEAAVSRAIEPFLSQIEREFGEHWKHA